MIVQQRRPHKANTMHRQSRQTSVVVKLACVRVVRDGIQIENEAPQNVANRGRACMNQNADRIFRAPEIHIRHFRKAASITAMAIWLRPKSAAQHSETISGHT
ncbi:MAG TPA: hypothetical protein VMU80_10240 [Bryobacteraceae bacterium]|nr:hypothetical protein [Bryobacteraceae bacterium]